MPAPCASLPSYVHDVLRALCMPKPGKHTIDQLSFYTSHPYPTVATALEELQDLKFVLKHSEGDYQIFSRCYCPMDVNNSEGEHPEPQVQEGLDLDEQETDFGLNPEVQKPGLTSSPRLRRRVPPRGSIPASRVYSSLASEVKCTPSEEHFSSPSLRFDEDQIRRQNHAEALSLSADTWLPEHDQAAVRVKSTERLEEIGYAEWGTSELTRYFCSQIRKLGVRGAQHRIALMAYFKRQMTEGNVDPATLKQMVDLYVSLDLIKPDRPAWKSFIAYHDMLLTRVTRRQNDLVNARKELVKTGTTDVLVKKRVDVEEEHRRAIAEFKERRAARMAN